MQLFLVVIRRGVFHLRADLANATFDFGSLTAAFDDRGVVLVDGDLLGAPEILNLHVLQLDAEVFGDGLAAGQGRDIFEHRLATIAEAGSLNRGALQGAAQLVDHQRRQRFAFDVFRDDHQGLAHLGNLLEQGEKILHRGDFLFVDQDAHIFQGAFHALRVGDKVRREVAAVELHAFDHFQRGFHGLGFFHGDHAILADLLHRFGNDAADLLVVIGADGADLGDHVALDVFVLLLHFFNRDGNGLFDAALEGGRGSAGRNGLHAFLEDSLSQHGGGGGAVARDVRRLGGNFTNHLRAHVLERVLQFDFFRYGDAVFGDDRRAELLFDYGVAALGTQRDLDGISQLIDAAQDRLAGILTSYDLLCHDLLSPR